MERKIDNELILPMEFRQSFQDFLKSLKIILDLDKKFRIIRIKETGKSLFDCPIYISPDVNNVILLSEDNIVVGKIINIGK